MCAHGEKITPPLVTDRSIGWLIVDWLIRVTDWRRTTWPPRWCCSSLQQSLRTSSSLSWHSSLSRCPYERHRSRRCKPAMSLADISYIVDLHWIWQQLLAPSIRRRSSTAIISGEFIVFSWSRFATYDTHLYAQNTGVQSPHDFFSAFSLSFGLRTLTT